MAAATPQIAGQISSAIRARNWWATVGWSLRAVDTVLIERRRLDRAPQYPARLEYARAANVPAHEVARAGGSQDEQVAAKGRWMRDHPHPDRDTRRGALVCRAVD